MGLIFTWPMSVAAWLIVRSLIAYLRAFHDRDG